MDRIRRLKSGKEKADCAGEKEGEVLQGSAVLVSTYSKAIKLQKELGGRLNYLVMDARDASEVEQLIPLELDPLRIVIINSTEKAKQTNLFTRFKDSGMPVFKTQLD